MGKKRTDYGGKPIRLSNRVLEHLEGHKGEGESWDTLIRRLLGLAPRKGEAPNLVQVWLLPEVGEAYSTLAQARGAALKNSLAYNMKREIPILVREVPPAPKKQVSSPGKP